MPTISFNKSLSNDSSGFKSAGRLPKSILKKSPKLSSFMSAKNNVSFIETDKELRMDEEIISLTKWTNFGNSSAPLLVIKEPPCGNLTRNPLETAQPMLFEYDRRDFNETVVPMDIDIPVLCTYSTRRTKRRISFNNLHSQWAAMPPCKKRKLQRQSNSDFCYE